MPNLPQTCPKPDRRDVISRLAAPVPCPDCGASPPKVALMARTEHLLFFGCDACWHVWSVAKPGHEHVRQLAVLLRRAD